MKLDRHNVQHDETGETIAVVSPASQRDVNYVLAADESGHDGRSNWVWLRLANGDLILGVFPQGDTYEYVTNRSGADAP